MSADDYIGSTQMFDGNDICAEAITLTRNISVAWIQHLIH